VITRKELAWRALKLAEDRFSDAAIVIADNVVFEGKPPTDAELEAYRNATRALSRAHREYAKTINM
jgi:predicted O-methyltransferase YrrM